MTSPFAGVGYLFRGIGLLKTPGLRRFVMMPLTINTMLFAGLIWYLTGQLEQLDLWVQALLPDWLDWLSWLLWPLFMLLSTLVIFYTFTLVANVIAAPFNGLLAEKVELHLKGKKIESDDDWKTLMKEALPMVLAELRKLLYFVLRALPLLILFFIPVLNVAAPILWFLFSAWMLAVDYIDFPLGNHKQIFPANVDVLRKRRGLALGFGGMTSVLSLIPVLNFITVPAAVAGATALYVERIDNDA